MQESKAYSGMAVAEMHWLAVGLQIWENSLAVEAKPGRPILH